MYPPMPESTPTPGSGLQPAPSGSKGIGPVPLAIGILALVIVLGVVTGLLVMLLRPEPGPPAPPPPPPPSSAQVPSWPASADPSPSTPPSSQVPAGSPVSVGNLPTSGDLSWPNGQWDSGETTDAAGEEPASQCQTWRPSQLAGLTGSAGREYALKGPTKGRAHAYVLSFTSETEAVAAHDQLFDDAVGCAGRLGGQASERHQADAPWGSGAFVDVVVPGPERTVSTGVGRVGNRLVWLVVEVNGTDLGAIDVQADPNRRHTMINSLPKAMRRIR